MKTYLVGGAVRDKLLGLPVKDKDWLVVNADQAQMLEKGFIQVGKKFPVFLHPKTHEEYALARTEKKTGKGYKAFEFNTDNITLIDDLSRRDLTINAMVMDEKDVLYDPFNGQKDLKDKKLRHVSSAFSEDPLRVLRVARFAAKLHHLGFSIAAETLQLMQKIVANNELEALSSERIFQEFIRALQTANPEIFIQILQELGTFLHILKPLNNLTHRALIPLLTATKNDCHDTHILLALTLTYSADEQQLTAVLDELRVPKTTHILCMNVYRYHQFFSTLRSHSAEDILQKLKAIDALRNKSAFKQFMLTLQYIYLEDAQALSNFNLAKKIQQALICHEYESALKDIRNKQTIAKTVTNLQLKLIKETCKI